jgi:hypothetical protein
MCAWKRGRPVWRPTAPRGLSCVLAVVLAGWAGARGETAAPPGGGEASAVEGSTSASPWSTAHRGDGLDAALSEVSRACAEKLRADFEEGRARHLECDRERVVVASLLAPPADAVFGVGRLWQITTHALWMETAEAYACERWPLKRGVDLALSREWAEHAGCALRPRTRPLNLVARLEDGSSIVVEGALPAAPEGRQVWFGDLLASVSLPGGLSDLRKIRRLGLGEEAWLVELDVPALFRGLTDRAAVWSVQGWATPHLFGALTAEHPFDYGAAMLGLERLMVRQERDFTGVIGGDMSPQTFLLRHAWSPYLVAVRRHVGVWGARAWRSPGSVNGGSSAPAVGGDVTP